MIVFFRPTGFLGLLLKGTSPTSAPRDLELAKLTQNDYDE
jgi:hypothetical protein